MGTDAGRDPRIAPRPGDEVRWTTVGIAVVAVIVSVDEYVRYTATTSGHSMPFSAGCSLDCWPDWTAVDGGFDSVQVLHPKLTTP